MEPHTTKDSPFDANNTLAAFVNLAATLAGTLPLVSPPSSPYKYLTASTNTDGFIDALTSAAAPETDKVVSNW